MIFHGECRVEVIWKNRKMSAIFEEQDSDRRAHSNYRYVPINSPNNADVSSDLESSGKGFSTSVRTNPGLPDMDVEDDCLPPSPNNYGTFSREMSRMRTVVSKLPEGDVPPYRAIFLVTNAAFGAGILNFPEAYMNAGGLETALCVQCVSADISVE